MVCNVPEYDKNALPRNDFFPCSITSAVLTRHQNANRTVIREVVWHSVQDQVLRQPLAVTLATMQSLEFALLDDTCRNAPNINMQQSFPSEVATPAIPNKDHIFAPTSSQRAVASIP